MKQGAGGTTFYFSGLYELRTTLGQPATHVMYIPGESGMIAQATQVEGSAAPIVEYLHGDHQGSVNAVTTSDGSSADLTQMRFDPFGARIGTTNPPMSISPPASPVADVTLGFTGHEQDDELGLINMGGRIYDPALARFLTPDPLVSRPWKSQSFNRYSYVENSPLKFIDPSGLQEMDDSKEKTSEKSGDGKDGERGREGGHDGAPGIDWSKVPDPEIKATASPPATPPSSPPPAPPASGQSTDSEIPGQHEATPVNPPGLTTFADDSAPSGGSNGSSTSPSSRLSEFLGTVASVGHNLIDTFVPGAHYMGLAQNAFANQDYLRGSVFVVSAIIDAGLGVATGGEATIASGATRESSAHKRGWRDRAAFRRCCGVCTVNRSARRGKHAGFLKQAQSFTRSQLNRAANSFQRQIELHEAKMANPGNFISEWGLMMPVNNRACWVTGPTKS